MANEAIQEQLRKNKEVSDRIHKEGVDRLTKGKPTPTQEENDRAKLGEHVVEHEEDGSGPDDRTLPLTRAMESGRGGVYQTRDTHAATQHGGQTQQARQKTER